MVNNPILHKTVKAHNAPMIDLTEFSLSLTNPQNGWANMAIKGPILISNPISEAV